MLVLTDGTDASLLHGHADSVDAIYYIATLMALMLSTTLPHSRRLLFRAQI